MTTFFVTEDEDRHGGQSSTHRHTHQATRKSHPPLPVCTGLPSKLEQSRMGVYGTPTGGSTQLRVLGDNLTEHFAEARESLRLRLSLCLCCVWLEDASSSSLCWPTVLPQAGHHHVAEEHPVEVAMNQQSPMKRDANKCPNLQCNNELTP